MSGYSDKEYLKAAIKLKAVNYIEKPFRLSEIEDAIREARDLYIRKVNSRHGETLHSMETASRLALQLTLPYSQDNSVIRQLSDELQFTMNSSTFFTAFIVKTKLFLEASTPSMADLFQKFQDFLNPYHITCVYLEKKFQYMVYFLFSQTPPSRQILTHAGSFLMEHFAEFGRYSMARGDTVCGVSRAYQTYTSAVILLQSSYFFSENTLLTSDEDSELPNIQNNIFASSPASVFAEALSNIDQNAASALLEKLLQSFPTTANFFRIRSKICTTSFFSVWRMHVISRKFQVPAIRKLLRKQSTDVLPSVNFTRLLLIKQKIFLRKFLTVLRKTLLFF